MPPKLSPLMYRNLRQQQYLSFNKLRPKVHLVVQKKVSNRNLPQIWRRKLCDNLWKVSRQIYQTEFVQYLWVLLYCFCEFSLPFLKLFLVLISVKNILSKKTRICDKYCCFFVWLNAPINTTVICHKFASFDWNTENSPFQAQMSVFEVCMYGQMTVNWHVLFCTG